MKDKAKIRSASLYWRANLILLTVLLGLWFFSACVLSIVFVESLNEIQWGGFPLGFWFSQQGTIYVFILLIFTYAIFMERLDRKHGMKDKK